MLIARSWCEGQLAHPAGMSCSLIVNSKGMNGINNFWNWTCPSDWTNGKPPTQLVPLWNESSCNMEAASANRKSIRVNMKAVVFLKQNCTEDICREEPGSKDECIELQIFIALIIKVTIFFSSILAITLYTCMVIMHNTVHFPAALRVTKPKETKVGRQMVKLVSHCQVKWSDSSAPQC